MASKSGPQRPAALPACGLLAGVAGAELLPFDRPLLPWLAVTLLALGLAARGHLLSRTSVFLALLAVGSWLESADRLTHATAVERLLPEAGQARELHFTGEVLAAPELDFEGHRLLRLSGQPEERSGSPARVALQLRVPPATDTRTDPVDRLEAGDRVRLWCRLRRPPRSSPAERRSSLRARRLHAVGTVKSGRLIERIAGSPSARWVDPIRRTARRRLDQLLGPTGPERSLVGAMLLADRAALDPALRRLLRDAGLLHLVAISGLHVGLLVWMVHALLSRTVRRPWPRFAIVMLLLAVFAATVGARASVLRAVLAAAMLLFGRCLGRPGEPLNGLLLVAAGLAVVSPASVGTPGFQLTFLGAAGILTTAQRLKAQIRLGRSLANGLAVSSSAYLATAPAVAWHFGWLAPVAVASNLIALPLCGVTLAAGYGAILLSMLPPLGALCGWIADQAAGSLLQVARVAAGWDPGAFFAGGPSAVTVGLYYGLWSILATCRPGGGPGIGRQILRSLLVTTLIWIHLGPVPPAGRGGTVVSLIDVGQGLAVASQGPGGELVLIDAGGSADRRFDPGERKVLPFIADRAGRRLAALILTHDHLDHIGGAWAVLREIEVGELWLGPGSHRSPRLSALAALAREQGTAIVLAERGTTRSVAGLAIRILAPARGAWTGGPNDRSVVVLVGRAPARLLVPGDLEPAGERSLIDSGAVLRAEALVLAHHGSRLGSSAAFLERVAPRWALLSVGRSNPFGHPDPSVIRRVEHIGATLLRTDRPGRVELREVEWGWVSHAP